ncbi:MAG: VWA domain-containing protein [Pseudonocardia sp.]
MVFQWPFALLGLIAVPLLAGVYVWQQRRRRRNAVRLSSVALVRAAAPQRRTWRRHVPVALLLAALGMLGLAAARPQVGIDVPISRSTVILAVDVSGSMCATDVDPNRLGAAQAAVREFVAAQDPATSVGLIIFSGFAQIAVAPTTEREPVLRALDAITTGRGTAIGAAVLKSVDAIAEIDPDVAPSSVDGSPGATEPPPRAPGTYVPEIVVLLTDGANTRGVEPIDAARAAAARGVRVYPIGFGTRNPTMMVCSAAQLGGRVDGYGGARRPTTAIGGSYLVADEPTLREVASITGGEYFAAEDAQRLQQVLTDLPRSVTTQHREVELSVWFGAAAVALILAGLWAAARWTAFPS